MLYVEADLSRRTCRSEHVEAVKVVEAVEVLTLLKLDNLPIVGWIIPPSLRNNGLHCIFVQVRKLVGYFSSIVPFSLRRELPNFMHLKQGNGVHPCKVYALSHNGVKKKRFLKI